MTPDALRALAKRVAEEQPSRELDVEVHVACGLGYATHNGHVAMGSSCGAYGVGHYTTSLDDAETARPKSCVPISIFYDGDGRAVASTEMIFSGVDIEARAPTEPQARTAAALLALAADMEARDAQ